jgi:small subunit ribosomal protein S2
VSPGVPTPERLTIARMLATGMHLGHAEALWHPLNLPFIFGTRAGIHIINLEHTLTYLRRASRVVRDVAYQGGIILFVSTREGQQHLALQAARRSGNYYVSQRWVAGTITNAHKLLRRSQQQGNMTTKQAELEAVPITMDPEFIALTEGNTRPTTGRPRRNRGRNLEDIPDPLATATVLRPRQDPIYRPDLMVVLNPLENRIALSEAQKAHIPTIGLIDTDCDPRCVTYPIPGNDDSLRSVELIAGVLSMAARDGALARAADLERQQELARVKSRRSNTQESKMELIKEQEI